MSAASKFRVTDRELRAFKSKNKTKVVEPEGTTTVREGANEPRYLPREYAATVENNEVALYIGLGEDLQYIDSEKTIELQNIYIEARHLRG